MEATPQQIQQFVKLISSETGLSFTKTNLPILTSRISQKLIEFKFDDVSEYYRLILTDEEERKRFFDFITTNLTFFHRNEKQYQVLIHSVLPSMIAEKQKLGDSTFKIWSAGCSTGEEVYTNAIFVKENIPSNFKLALTGSDLSMEALLKAKKAVYKRNAVDEHMPANLVSKYFEIVSDTEYKIVQEIQDIVKFDFHNLIHPPTIVRQDIIFCRNVLIYFDQVTVEKIIGYFYNLLPVGGFLFIGHSESLIGLKTDFQLTKLQDIFVYRKLK